MSGKLSDSIRYGLVSGALRCAALLPLWALHGVSSVVAPVLHHVVKYRRSVVRRNLSNAFPEMDEAQFRSVERRFYRNLCDTAVETVKLLHVSDRAMRRRVELRGCDVVEDLASQNRPIILFMGHCGNWEWVPAMTLSLELTDRMGALYKPLHDRVMDRLMLTIRGRFAHECIPASKAYRRLVEMKRLGKSFMMGFIADQRPVGQPLNHWTEFLNQPTPFMAGGETIGERVGAAFVYLDIERTARGHYALTFKRMTTDPDDTAPYPYTRLFYRMLEDSIRRQPDAWLWSHNRWKANQPG